jgi:hypothetical protein
MFHDGVHDLDGLGFSTDRCFVNVTVEIVNWTTVASKGQSRQEQDTESPLCERKQG